MSPQPLLDAPALPAAESPQPGRGRGHGRGGSRRQVVAVGGVRKVEWWTLEQVADLMDWSLVSLQAFMEKGASSFFPHARKLPRRPDAKGPGPQVLPEPSWWIPTSDLTQRLKVTQLQPMLRLSAVAKLTGSPRTEVKRWLERGQMAGVVLPNGGWRVTQEAYLEGLKPLQPLHERRARHEVVKGESLGTATTASTGTGTRTSTRGRGRA